MITTISIVTMIITTIISIMVLTIVFIVGVKSPPSVGGVLIRVQLCLLLGGLASLETGLRGEVLPSTAGLDSFGLVQQGFDKDTLAYLGCWYARRILIPSPMYLCKATGS